MSRHRHSEKSITRAATLFFVLRSVVRARLAAGQRLDPYKWLRIETLVYIRDHEGPSMKDIADYLSITAPSATSLVASLARSGLVERKVDRTDRRATRIYLTLQGKRELARAVTRGMRTFRALFATLSSTELKAFSEALARMVSSAHGSESD